MHGKVPRAAGSPGRYDLWRQCCAQGFNLGLQETHGVPEREPHISHSHTWPLLWCRGRPAALRLRTLQTTARKSHQQGCHLQPHSSHSQNYKSQGLAWQMISLSVVIGNSAWDLEKSGPAFSMPCAITRDCPIGEITGSLAFALCGAEVMTKHLFLLGIGSKHDLLRNKQELARAVKCCF